VEADVEAGVEAGVEAAMEMDVEAAMEVDVEAAMEATLEAAVADLLQVLEAPPCELVLVTNEVGLGIVPVNAVGRRFRDRAGALNQQVARRAHVVKLLVCGQPLVVKGA
jgi:adenosyl cobinamide kinase/adenosyl cobinamide phosphate guanylyltransferase